MSSANVILKSLPHLSFCPEQHALSERDLQILILWGKYRFCLKPNHLTDSQLISFTVSSLTFNGTQAWCDVGRGKVFLFEPLMRLYYSCFLFWQMARLPVSLMGLFTWKTKRTTQENKVVWSHLGLLNSVLMQIWASCSDVILASSADLFSFTQEHTSSGMDLWKLKWTACWEKGGWFLQGVIIILILSCPEDDPSRRPYKQFKTFVLTWLYKTRPSELPLLTKIILLLNIHLKV